MTVTQFSLAELHQTRKAKAPEARQEGQDRGEAGVHNSSPLLQLVGGSLQLGEQEVVQAGVAVEELSSCDSSPCRLSLSCTIMVSLHDCISFKM